MQLYFIRHGQSSNNLLYEQNQSNAGRSDDPELTEKGRQQAEHLARFLIQTSAIQPADGRDLLNVAGFKLTHLYTSLMVRSVATASVVAHAVGLPLVAWADLHEEGGIYLEDAQGNKVGCPGKSRSYFVQNYPWLILPDEVGEAGWWNRPHEGEAERQARGLRVWKELLARHGSTNDRVAVISHGGFYNQFLAAVLRAPIHHPDGGGQWFHLQNTAITRLDTLNGWVDWVYQNRVDFLPRELIT